MNIRRTAPLVFVALCLGLSAFVLRGQFAAHPRPQAASGPRIPGNQRQQDGPSLPGVPKGWHVATEPVRRAALATIGDQLAAIRAGDADRAWFYQSRGLHKNFPSGRAFVEIIRRGHPEFGHAASATYGPVLTNAAGNHAGVAVTVRGQNGRLAPAFYWLTREEGGYKVAAVEGGRAIN